MLISIRESDINDFGLARKYNTNPDSIRSMTNSMTECYAPIGQYQRHGKFRAYTSVHALAATLYVLVTKQMPFPARFREHAELVPLKKHNPQLSDRPQTVKAWLEMLKPPQQKPQPKPSIQATYTEPLTVPILPKPTSKPEPLVKTEPRRNENDSTLSKRQENTQNDLDSSTVTKRSGLGNLSSTTIDKVYCDRQEYPIIFSL